MEKLGAVKKMMEKEEDVKKAAAGPEEKLPIAPGPPTPCYKNTVGEDAKFLERVKDYFTQVKDNPAEKHWICLKNKVRAAGEYVSQKGSSIFGKQKVEPVVKDENLEAAKPAAVESH